MTWLVIVVATAFLTLLIVHTHVRRRRIRAHLLRAGARVDGDASLVQRGRRTRIAVRYRDSGGVERRALTVRPSTGRELASGSLTRVVFDPTRTSRDDHVLVGFGRFPARWLAVQFDRRAA